MTRCGKKLRYATVKDAMRDLELGKKTWHRQPRRFYRSLALSRVPPGELRSRPPSEHRRVQGRHGRTRQRLQGRVVIDTILTALAIALILIGFLFMDDGRWP